MQEKYYALFNWALLNIAFILAYQRVTLYKREKINGYAMGNRDVQRYYFLFFIFLMYSLFTFFGGDKKSYQEMVIESGMYGFKALINMENIYVWLGILVKGDFLLWKLIVYGGSLLLTHLSLKRLGVDNIISLLFFSGMCLLSYGATRAILAYAVYIFGLSFVREKNKLKILVGWVIVVSSYFFHNSMIPIIAMTPLIYFNLTKKRVIVLLLIFPIVQMVFNVLISGAFEHVFSFAEDYGQDHLQQKNEWYLDDTRSGGGSNTFSLSAMVQNILSLTLDFSLLWVAFNASFKEKIPVRFTTYLSMGFFLFYFVWLLRFSSLYNSMFMHQRYLGMFPFYTFILGVPLFMYTLENKKWYTIIVFIMIAKFNYNLFLMIYHAS